ncbi:hypothetical protein HDV00_012660 [Rhizophlyctis rosea]|nr:hypothetical protein HDV00_012660 [Rhizophlyctis rosea]
MAKHGAEERVALILKERGYRDMGNNEVLDKLLRGAAGAGRAYFGQVSLKRDNGGFPLKADFIVATADRTLCIEVDGEQHYGLRSFPGANHAALESRDIEKVELLGRAGIDVYRIPLHLLPLKADFVREVAAILEGNGRYKGVPDKTWGKGNGKVVVG